MDTNGTALANVADAEIVPHEYDGLTMVTTPAEAKKRLLELQSFVRSVMVKGDDYGRIPGTQKDTLYKAGAEKLAELYGFAFAFEIVKRVEDWDKPLFYYEAKCTLTSRRDGRFICDGMGSCNSREDKYAWRWLGEKYLPPGIDKAGLKKKRSGKGNNTWWSFRLPNEDIFSVINTLQKMACKRALVMAVIGATRSSALFTQDLEDMPREEEPEEEAQPLDQQLDAAIVAEQDKLAALFEADLRRADTEEKVMGIGQLIAQAHATKKITDAHRASLRKTFADVSKGFK
ncbi:MAG: hypothetical protein V4529_16590 [Gemmatimonadota bacterium]